MNTPSPSKSSGMGWLALAAAPLFFSTNIIFGRAANSIDPFTLSFLRWSISACVLLIIIRPHWSIARKLVAEHWKLMTLCGFLAMWVCGGLVYLALKSTTATNATLIYTTPPLMIIVIERIIRGREIKGREIIGILAATLGIAVIITKGDLLALAELNFNHGDMMIVLAAISWSIYTLLLRSKALEGIPTRVVFGVSAAFGALTILPFAADEFIYSANYPKTITDWQMIAGIVMFSSLIPFSLYQFGNRMHGAAAASVFMYLLPPCGLGLAWLFLNEIPNQTTLIGCLLVLGGVIVATIPIKIFKR